MIKYNFIKNYTGLKKWEQAKVLTKKEKATSFNLLSTKKNILEFLNKIRREKFLCYPPLTILLISLAFQLISIPSRLKIYKLRSIHQEYITSIALLNDTKLDLKSYIYDLADYGSLYSSAAPSFIFAYFLQQSIPQDVELKQYIIDKDAFKIEANGQNLQSINEMVALLLDSPLVLSDSLEIKEITMKTNNNSSAFINSYDTYTEIQGKINPLPLKNRILYFDLSDNHGYSKKLNPYLKLIELFNKKGT